MLIVAKPILGSSGSNIDVLSSGSLLGKVSKIDVRSGLQVVISGSTARIDISGSSVLGSVLTNAGEGPAMHLPVTSLASGWLVNDQGYLLISG